MGGHIFYSACAVACSGKGQSGAVNNVNNHWKNTKITGEVFRMKTNSKINTASKSYHLTPQIFAWSLRILWGIPVSQFSPVDVSRQDWENHMHCYHRCPACDQAPKGCAWLMHLHPHVHFMMSWGSVVSCREVHSSVTIS